MILFATGYDEATRSGMVVAGGLEAAGDTVLLGVFATRHQLHGALSTSQDAPLLAMSHGRPDRLQAHGGDASDAALTISDLACLSGRSVFAFACLTGLDLGAAVSRMGGIWHGYVVAITAIPDDIAMLPVFRDLFRFIRAGFPTVSNQGSANTFLRNLAAHCESCEDALESLTAGDHNMLAPLMCVQQIRRDIAIHLPGLSVPVRPARS